MSPTPGRGDPGGLTAGTLMLMTSPERTVDTAVGAAAVLSWWSWRGPAILATWTLLVWVGRVRNVIDDDALTPQGRNLRLALAFSFIAPALVVAATAAIGMARRSVVAPAATMTTLALCAWTVVVWAVRGLDIVTDGSFDVGFRVVHSALALVSVAVAGWVARSLWKR